MNKIYKPIVQLPFPLVLSKSIAKSQAAASQISWTEPSIDIMSALTWCSWGPISYTSSYASSVPNKCPIVGIWPPRYRSNPAHSLLFPSLPLSYWVVHGSIYYIPVVRDSCLFSAGVLQDLLHLKMYSWCICGERYSTSTYSSTIFSYTSFTRADHALNHRQTACHGHKQVQAR